MNGRNRAQSLAASPTMVGAITTLIVIVAVFLAYNANNGLPFVPTYRVNADICNAARLAPNNEVRIGGNRVGVVEGVTTVDAPAGACQDETGAPATTAARLQLKLDQSAKPIPSESTIQVRYRSSFGLKYLELERRGDEALPEGGTLDIAQSEEQTEFDDIGNTFDTPTRENSRRNLQGFGSGLAGRGASLNQAIESLNPLFSNLLPVSEALTAPGTRLVRFFPELADAARIVAPVAQEQADFFRHAAIAFGAISGDEEALRDTISEGPPTLETGIRVLPGQRPFLKNFADFSRLLRPGVRDLRASLPILNGAIEIGTKTLRRTPEMNQNLEEAMAELEELVDEPSTKKTLIRLGDFFEEAESAGKFIVPYQTVCNYWNYWFQFIPEHFSGEDAFGLAERLIGPTVPGTTTPEEYPRNPFNNISGGQADGRFSEVYKFPPFDGFGIPGGMFDPLPANDDDPDDEITQPILYGPAYGPSGTQAAPNCQSGQQGFPLGQLLLPGQPLSNPAIGVPNVTKAAGVAPLGKTDLFLRQNGVREFRGD